MIAPFMNLRRLLSSICGGLALLFAVMAMPCGRAAEPSLGTEWSALFDGVTLQGWKITPFGGHGEVTVKDGELRIGAGAILSGITWTNEVVRMDYEIEVEAKKTAGGDFFCALTIPVRGTNCTFVVGGWGGSVVGISSLDGMDASENETSKFLTFETGRWYKIKVRVTEAKIEGWIDDEKIVDAKTLGRKIGMRAGEIEENVPLGIATYQTGSAIRSMRMRRFVPPPKKIVFLAGKKSHGQGDHEYEKGLALFQKSLETSPNVPKLRLELCPDGWPANPATLDDADTIVLFSDGADHDEKAHPLLEGDRLRVVGRQMKRGCGLVALHYSVFVPVQHGGGRFLDWLGGFFDFETGTATNKWFSKIENREFALAPVRTDHPILRGVGPFTLKDELYFNMKFTNDEDLWVPLLAFGPDLKAKSAVVAWAYEREDGGRGFAFTGGHTHALWKMEALRRFVLNGILWSARVDVPANGVQSTVAGD